MRTSINTRGLLLSLVAALLLAIAIPSTSLAQGRGHGRGHIDGDWSNRDRSNRGWRRTRSNLPNYSKKCGKFVNCHDARAGRWDGRGPRRNRVGNLVWRNRVRNRNATWRYRNRTNRRVIINP
jgi:hypothetical protein